MLHHDTLSVSVLFECVFCCLFYLKVCFFLQSVGFDDSKTRAITHIKLR